MIRYITVDLDKNRIIKSTSNPNSADTYVIEFYVGDNTLRIETGCMKDLDDKRYPHHIIIRLKNSVEKVRISYSHKYESFNRFWNPLWMFCNLLKQYTGFDDRELVDIIDEKTIVKDTVKYLHFVIETIRTMLRESIDDPTYRRDIKLVNEVIDSILKQGEANEISC